MIWELISKLWKRNKLEINGAAHRAKLEADRKLAEARRMRPATQEASDQLAEWIESALRGSR